MSGYSKICVMNRHTRLNLVKSSSEVFKCLIMIVTLSLITLLVVLYACGNYAESWVKTSGTFRVQIQFQCTNTSARLVYNVCTFYKYTLQCKSTG